MSRERVLFSSGCDVVMDFRFTAGIELSWQCKAGRCRHLNRHSVSAGLKRAAGMRSGRRRGRLISFDSDQSQLEI